MERCRGMTWAELIVLVLLVGLLVLLLVPSLFIGSMNRWPGAKAYDAACGMNLKWWYCQIRTYEVSRGEWPPGEGTEMLRRLWVSGMIEKTDANLTRFFCPHRIGKGLYQELRYLPDLEDLWRDGHETSEMDYACAKDRVDFNDERRPWMADDNHDGQEWNHWDRSMNVLYGDGNVHLFTLEELVDRGVLTADESADLQAERSDLVLRCGPGSRLPDLRDLRY